MTAQRRGADPETAQPVERIWQIYADHIGIPQGESAANNESLPRQDEHLRRGRRSVRVIAGSARRPLAAAAVGMIAAIAGIALWMGSSSSPDTSDRRTATQASAPAGQAERLAQRAAPSTHAGDGVPALASPVPAPGDIVDPLRPPSPDAAVSRPIAAPPSSAVFTPVATQTSEKPSAMTKQEGTNVMSRIAFDFGSDGINDESKRTLDKIVAALKANSDWRIVIEGHTDAQGTPDYNRVLSERRAQAVEDYLETAGIAPGRLRAVGFGASRPVAPNDARGNAVNRRVEIRRQ